MDNSGEFGSDYAQEQLRRSRHPLRRLIKYIYNGNIVREVKGPTVDFGCGAGQLLARLPAGSLGLEINPFLVEALQKRRLNVSLYAPDDDDFSLRDLKQNHFSTLVMAHVLEHFADPVQVLHKLLRSCARIGISRLVVVVPGAKGYASDTSHKTFVDMHYLQSLGLLSREGYSITKSIYFPMNVESLGKHFTFHELMVVYDRAE